VHIRSFHIDGFGIFSDLDVPALSPGLNIFLGENESGKSTCLDFFRVMLCGYPHPNSRELSRPPLKGGQAGGFLLLETPRHGIVRLTRRPGPGDGLRLNDQDGKALDPALLDTIMGGATRELYRNVFAFSLSELQTLRTLATPDVRNALYGASFGMGLRSPAAILKRLDDHLGKMFAPQGRKLRMNTALVQLEEVRAALRAAQEESARFDALALQYGGTEAALRTLREAQAAHRLERRSLERRLGVWRQWEEWRRAGMALERLQPVAGTFPADGPARLERAVERREAAARHLRTAEEQLARLHAGREAIAVNEAMLALVHELPLLAERKGSCRNALAALPAQYTALARGQEELARLLSGLGPDWTCERIRATNRSLFAREELERQARDMDVADQSYNAAAAQLQRANGEAKSASYEAEIAGLALERLSVPAAALDEEERERLRYILARLEENRRRLPERMQTLHRARSESARSCLPLHLKADAPDEVLDMIIHAQEGARERADIVQSRVAAATEAEQAAEQAQMAEETARARLDRLRARLRDRQGINRGLLDGKNAALRKLRQVSADLTREISRLAELDERLQRPEPEPLKSPLLMGLGALLAVTGFGLLFAHWQFGLKAIPFSPDFTFPVTLWSGYLIVVAGVAFLAGGLPRSGPELRQYREETALLRERRVEALGRIAGLEEQAQTLCANAGLGSAESSALDAAEAQLNLEREQLVTEERLNQELEEVQAEYGQVQDRARSLEGERIQAENAVQQARRRWHEYLLECYVETVPAPEAAGTFFARVEAARLARANVAALEKEAQEMAEQGKALELEARGMPPVAACLLRREEAHEDAGIPDEAAMPDEADPHDEAAPDEVFLAVRRVLDACREADTCVEERLKAAAALHSAEINLKRAGGAQKESAISMQEAAKRLESARAAWRGQLAGLGLGADLSPGTVREALECMERCLNAEAETARLRDGLAQLENERDALLSPLKEILDKLGCGAVSGADGLPDWPASLDMLLREAQAAGRAAEEKARIEQRIAEATLAARAAQAALNDEQRAETALLALAQADSAEDFLRHAATKAEREDLVRRRQDLEDALRLAAGDMPFDEFTASFAEFDRQEREQRLTALDAELERQEQEERALVDMLGELGARRSALDAAAEELAALRRKEEALRESLRQLMLEYGRHALARRLIESAKGNFERQSQPAVIRAASSIFAAMTDGAWTRINASLDDSALSVLPPHGEATPPEYLSRGAQEQLYLALRLAYIGNHAGRAASLPVIMDDILVNFDPARALRTAQALASLADGLPPRDGRSAIPPHQMLFFTCHPHLAEMLQNTVQGSALYRMDGGNISIGAL
jgi:uncharacterized protein YhaN